MFAGHTDDPNNAFTFNDFTLHTNWLNARSYFHKSHFQKNKTLNFSLRPKDNTTPGQIVWRNL